MVLSVQHQLVASACSTQLMNEDRLVRVDNLKRLTESWSLKASDLTHRVGGRYTYWRDLLAGKKSFGEKAARKIEDSLSLPRGWLDRTDEVPADSGAGRAATFEDDPDFALGARGGNVVGVPVTGTLYATSPADIDYFSGGPQGFVLGAGGQRGVHALRVQGDGAQGMRTGQFAVVEPADLIPGEYFLVEDADGATRIAEYLYDQGDAAVLEDCAGGDRFRIKQDQQGLCLLVVAVVSASKWVADPAAVHARTAREDERGEVRAQAAEMTAEEAERVARKPSGLPTAPTPPSQPTKTPRDSSVRNEQSPTGAAKRETS